MPTLEQSQYGFDRDNRRTWQRRLLTDAQDQQYNYDALGQVSAAARGSLNLNKTAISGRPASAQSWEYDPTGNWRGYHTSLDREDTLDQHRVHDRGNRMTQIESSPHNMILDRVGRMRQMAPDASGDWDGKLEITWDAWSRITKVKNNGEIVGEYAYDGQHRRITREVSGVTLHCYYNDAWRPVEERKDAETTAAMSYLWGARHRDDLVRRDRAVGGTALNETRYVLMDYFNPAAITDTAGVVKERYAFSAFGVRTILNPDFTVRSSSECAMEFGFQGQYLDTESGLMNYGYRYYSPQLGRWTCKDPIGEKGGSNLYVLVGNKAINQVDHLGLEAQIIVNAESVTAAINWLGWHAAVESVNRSRATGREYGGAICKKCCSAQSSTKWIVFAIGPNEGNFSLFNRYLRSSSTGNFNGICPNGSEAVGQYHSHPGNSGPSGYDQNQNKWKDDYARFNPDPQKQKQYISVVSSFVSGNWLEVLDPNQVPGAEDPEFVGWRPDSKTPAVSKIPSSDANRPPLSAEPPKPQTTSC